MPYIYNSGEVGIVIADVWTAEDIANAIGFEDVKSLDVSVIEIMKLVKQHYSTEFGINNEVILSAYNLLKN